MAIIRVLDSDTIDKIAAGEVVERPSSVVKELVENAMDAGATAVTVEIREGGIEFIRVTDNGSGMDADQVRNAFLRHATSKIRTAEDLFRISSLGFRGEALSSIAAVSKVELITKTADSLTGIRFVSEGGREVAFDEIGSPDGTTFLIRNLFYNTPVRRKFLKMPATEGGYIADLMEHLAMSRPDISFELVINGKSRFHTSGSGDLKEVIYRIYGRETAAELVPIRFTHEDIRVEGYLGKPILVRSSRNFEIYFVNGRFIKSNVIAKAVEDGYREYLMQHKFPLCVLRITMDTERVDVNVHPTKMEVRFKDPMTLCNLLTGAVHDALSGREMIPDVVLTEKKDAPAPKEEKPASTPQPFEKKRMLAFHVAEDSDYRVERGQVGGPKSETIGSPVVEKKSVSSVMTAAVADAIVDAKNEAGAAVKASDEKPVTSPVASEEFFFEDNTFSPAPEQEKKSVLAAPDSKIILPAPEKKSELTAPAYPDIKDASQLNLFEEKILTPENRAEYVLIGQVFDTYWIVQFENKMLIIDQHAAHEKVKYERLMKQCREKNVISQNLMPPIVVSLSAAEETVFLQYRDVFASLGFETESFGGREYMLRSVPVDLYGCGEKELFLEVLDELSEAGSAHNLTVVQEKLASMSCKAAVKGNNRLSRREMEELLDELLTLDNPYHCPHGRPTMITMSKAELEKKFKRIV